jgi:hypothetical protein
MNNTALILKDGKVYAFNMPEKIKGDIQDSGHLEVLHEMLLKKALSSAVLCADQEQAGLIWNQYYDDPLIAKDHPYVIPGLTFTPEVVDCGCRMGKDCQNSRTVALLSLQEKTEQPLSAVNYGNFLTETYTQPHSVTTNSTELIEEKTEKQEPVCQKCIDKDLEIQELKSEIEELSLYKHACNESIAHLDRENKALLDQIKDLGNQM